MENNQEIYCPHCGAKMVRYKHSLSQNFVRALWKFYGKKPPINLSDVGLTWNEHNNFQKLQHWDLVNQYFKEGVRLSGVWDLTERGRKFLAGQIKVNKTVVTYRGERERYEGDEVSADDLWEEIKWKQRPEYIADSEPIIETTQGELF